MITMKEKVFNSIVRRMLDKGTFHPICVAVLETTTGAHILNNADSDDLGAFFAIPTGMHEQVTGIMLYDWEYGLKAEDYRRLGKKPVTSILAGADFTGLKPGKFTDFNDGMIESRYRFRIGELVKYFTRSISDEYTVQEDGEFYQNIAGVEDIAF